MTASRARRNAQHLETFGGLLIAMTVLVLGFTIHAEVTGRPALQLVGVLVLLLIADVVVVRAARGQRERAHPDARGGRTRDDGPPRA